MLNYVEYPSSVKEGTETPGAFDQNGQRFYVLDRLQEQVSRIRYLLDTTVFFRNQLETCQAAGNAEAAQSALVRPDRDRQRREVSETPSAGA